MTLYNATTAAHHDAENHPFGQRMAAGRRSRQEWADWLQAMLDIHTVLDPYLPTSLQRGGDLALDLYQMLPVRGERTESAQRIVEAIRSGDLSVIGGVSYILCGANLRGGQVIKEKLIPVGFPCNHLTFESFVEPNKWLGKLRECGVLADSANTAFKLVLDVMSEIDERQ